ncbi:MAG: helix-turn-helix transcriptional regulator [Haliea sp.]
MADLYQHIGEKIRELRLAYPQGALSQEVLGTRLEIAANTISRWETGTYKPTPADLDKLARFFSTSIMDFFPESHRDEQRVAALTSATGSLSDSDFEEVVRYAEYRKARSAMTGAKRSPKKRQRSE